MQKINFLLAQVFIVIFTLACSEENLSLNNNKEATQFVYAKSYQDFVNYSVPPFLIRKIENLNSLAERHSIPNFQETFGDIVLNVDFRYVNKNGDVLKMYMLVKNNDFHALLIAAYNKEENKVGAYIINANTVYSDYVLNNSPLDANLSNLFSEIEIRNHDGTIQFTPINESDEGCYSYILTNENCFHPQVVECWILSSYNWGDLDPNWDIPDGLGTGTWPYGQPVIPENPEYPEDPNDRDFIPLSVDGHTYAVIYNELLNEFVSDNNLFYSNGQLEDIIGQDCVEYIIDNTEPVDGILNYECARNDFLNWLFENEDIESSEKAFISQNMNWGNNRLIVPKIDWPSATENERVNHFFKYMRLVVKFHRCAAYSYNDNTMYNLGHFFHNSPQSTTINGLTYNNITLNYRSHYNQNMVAVENVTFVWNTSWNNGLFGFDVYGTGPILNGGALDFGHIYFKNPFSSGTGGLGQAVIDLIVPADEYYGIIGRLFDCN